MFINKGTCEKYRPRPWPNDIWVWEAIIWSDNQQFERNKTYSERILWLLKDEGTREYLEKNVSEGRGEKHGIYIFLLSDFLHATLSGFFFASF